MHSPSLPPPRFSISNRMEWVFFGCGLLRFNDCRCSRRLLWSKEIKCRNFFFIIIIFFFPFFHKKFYQAKMCEMRGENFFSILPESFPRNRNVLFQLAAFKYLKSTCSANLRSFWPGDKIYFFFKVFPFLLPLFIYFHRVGGSFEYFENAVLYISIIVPLHTVTAKNTDVQRKFKKFFKIIQKYLFLQIH